MFMIVLFRPGSCCCGGPEELPSGGLAPDEFSSAGFFPEGSSSADFSPDDFAFEGSLSKLSSFEADALEEDPLGEESLDAIFVVWKGLQSMWMANMRLMQSIA